jgi:hypothetical protein
MRDNMMQRPKFSKIKGAIAPALAGVVLGSMIGYFQESQLLPTDSTVNPLTFQNFALYISLFTGLVFGVLAYTVFIFLYPRFQYPKSTKLGTWIGTISGGVLCFLTNLILNLFAPSFEYLRSIPTVFISNSLFSSLIGITTGCTIGYFFAEVGARNLHEY